MARRLPFLIVLMLANLLGCTTPGLRIESQPPGAEVQITVPGQSPRKVGQTPLDINEYAMAGAPAIQVSARASGRDLNKSV